jgi:regulatory protein
MLKMECIAKEGQKDTFTLFVDMQPWRDIHTTIFGRKPRFPKCATLNEWEAQFQELEYRAAKQYALRRLSVKSYLISELHKSLEDRFISEKNIQRVIQDCVNFGFLNDQKWLEGFVRTQLGRRLGPQAIMMKLRAKGFSQEQAHEALSQLDTREGQQERIQHLLSTRYRKRDLSDYSTRQKVIASLIRKGYSFSEIKAAMSALASSNS